jgi:hypothetical protein
MLFVCSSHIGDNNSPGRVHRLSLSWPVYQVGQCRLTQHIIHRRLHAIPQRPDRTQARLVKARIFTSDEMIAKIWIVQPATQHLQDIAYDDLLCRQRQGVSAVLSTNTLDESTAPHDAHDLCDVWWSDAFGVADFFDRERFGRTATGKLQQATQTVFFQRAELHGYIIPSSSLAASDIISMVHGGSQTTSTFASLISGISATLL